MRNANHDGCHDMRRWIFKILAVLSLLSFMATVALWVRSYWTCDCVGWAAFRGTYDRSIELYTGPGRIGVAFIHCIDHHPEWDHEAFAPRRTEFHFANTSEPPYCPHGRVG